MLPLLRAEQYREDLMVICGGGSFDDLKHLEEGFKDLESSELRDDLILADKEVHCGFVMPSRVLNLEEAQRFVELLNRVGADTICLRELLQGVRCLDFDTTVFLRAQHQAFFDVYRNHKVHILTVNGLTYRHIVAKMLMIREGVRYRAFETLARARIAYLQSSRVAKDDELTDDDEVIEIEAPKVKPMRLLKKPKGRPKIDYSELSPELRRARELLSRQNRVNYLTRKFVKDRRDCNKGLTLYFCVVYFVC